MVGSTLITSAGSALPPDPDAPSSAVMPTGGGIGAPTSPVVPLIRYHWILRQLADAALQISLTVYCGVFVAFASERLIPIRVLSYTTTRD